MFCVGLIRFCSRDDEDVDTELSSRRISYGKDWDDLECKTQFFSRILFRVCLVDDDDFAPKPVAVNDKDAWGNSVSSQFQAVRFARHN